MRIKVSIICGVYKSRKSIESLIKSLIHQSYTNIEIILCINGEDDGSKDIIRKYELKDSRIKSIYRKEKLGAGGARDVAFREASGDYIAVIDCDDRVKRDYIANLVKNIYDNNPDVVISGFQKIDVCGKIIYKRDYCSASSALVQSVAPWGKLYKREFLINNDIYFFNVPFGEDVLFTSVVILCKPKVLLIHKTDYIWVNRAESLSHTDIRHLPNGTVKCAERYFLNIRKRSFDGELFVYLVFKYYIWYLLQSGRRVGKNRILNEYKSIILTMNKISNGWEKKTILKALRWNDERAIVRIAVLIVLCMRKVGLDSFFIGLYGALPLGDIFWPRL